MAQTHTLEDITLEAPDDWSCEKQAEDFEVSAALRGPGASFITVSLYRERPDPANLIEAAVDAFRAEYQELDVYPVEDRLCDRETEACDLDFVCLDLVNSVFLRSFTTSRETVFILCQTDALELEETRAVFTRLCAALKCDDDSPADPGFPWR